MNYYRHHIGDYAQATAHLSFIEDAAYSRLIRKYYADERPLPPDIKAVQRLVGARTKEEKLAVEHVLEEFFFLEADGWHNKRCDEELARTLVQAEKNRQIAIEREKRRQKNGKSVGKSTGKDAEPVHEPCTNRAPQEHESCSDRVPQEHEPCTTDAPESHETAESRAPERTNVVNERTPNREPSHKPIANSHKPIDNQSTSQSVAHAREEVPISDTWEPGPTFWVLAKRANLSPGEDYADALTEFIAYWLDRPGEVRTQTQWERAFLESWKRLRVKRANSGQSSGSPPRKRIINGLSPHGDFDKRDYTAGINPDGSF